MYVCVYTRVCAWLDLLLYVLISMLHSFEGTASIHFVVVGGCVYSFGFFFKPIPESFCSAAAISVDSCVCLYASIYETGFYQ